ncbi:MAG TPA: hypothetical protein VII98_16160 [Solirubrobacteraceae bacterium]
MGLLDDAIREHLELKRRSGAEASELSRLERDAFGAGAAGPAEDAAHEPPADAEDGSVPATDEPFEFAAAAPAPAPAHEPEPAAEPAHAPLPEPEQPTRQFTLEEMQEAERREAPPVPVPHPEPEPEPPAAEPADHDELEETPEFLQETPEHDKLWFEQKPPKDFDF